MSAHSMNHVVNGLHQLPTMLASSKSIVVQLVAMVVMMFSILVHMVNNNLKIIPPTKYNRSMKNLHLLLITIKRWEVNADS